MTPDHFSKLQKVHNLPTNWLAAHVGRVSRRAFTYWMHGRPGQPDARAPIAVVKRFEALNLAITQALATSDKPDERHFLPDER